MHQPSRLTSALLLAAAMSLPYPAFAADSAAPAAPATATQPEPAPADGTAPPAGEAPAQAEEPAFELRYSINQGAEQTIAATEDAPWEAFLSILKQSIAEANKAVGQAVETRIMPPDAEEAAKELGMLPQLLVNTTVQADGKGRSDFRIDPLDKKITGGDDKPGHIAWQGLTGQMNYSGELEAPDFSFSAPGLKISAENEFSGEFSQLSLKGKLDQYNEPLKLDLQLPTLSFDNQNGSDPGNVSVTGIAVKADLEEVMEGLKMGSAEVGMQKFQFQEYVSGEQGYEPGGMAFLLEGLRLLSTGKLNDKLAEYDMELALDKLSLPADMIPIENFNEFSYSTNLQMRNLDASVIADIQKTARSMKQQGMSEEMMGIAMLGKLMESAPKLINASPKISINPLKFVSPQGNVDGVLKVSLDGDKLKADKSQQPLFNNPAALIGAVVADADITIAKALLKTILIAQMADSLPPPDPNSKEPMPTAEEMANMQIQQFIQQKFITDEGDNYKVVAAMKDGKLVVNGQEMPLPIH